MFFNLINFSQIKNKAYEYLLSLCDKVEFLYVNYDENSCYNCDIVQSEYEDVLNKKIGLKSGESWCMRGEIITFEISEQTINLITKIGLNGRLQLTEKSGLENLTLYKNNKMIYSVCSHEDIEEIDDNFKQNVENYCLNKIKSTQTYLDLLYKFENYKKESLDNIFKELIILGDLNAYVEEAWNKVIRGAPKYKCCFEKYINLAKKYLTKNTVNKIIELNDFKEFYQAGYPQTFEEINLYMNNRSFLEFEIYKTINEEISAIHALLFNELGFDK